MNINLEPASIQEHLAELPHPLGTLQNVEYREFRNPRVRKFSAGFAQISRRRPVR
jgi:hypothetical protein